MAVALAYFLYRLSRRYFGDHPNGPVEGSRLHRRTITIGAAIAAVATFGFTMYHLEVSSRAPTLAGPGSQQQVLTTSLAAPKMGLAYDSPRQLAQDVVDAGVRCDTFKPGQTSATESWGTCMLQYADSTGTHYATFSIGVFSPGTLEFLKDRAALGGSLLGPNWMVACSGLDQLCQQIQSAIGGTIW